jgi:hypothetical protein
MYKRVSNSQGLSSISCPPQADTRGPPAHLFESLLCSDGFQQGIQTAQLQVLHLTRFRTRLGSARLDEFWL